MISVVGLGNIDAVHYCKAVIPINFFKSLKEQKTKQKKKYID